MRAAIAPYPLPQRKAACSRFRPVADRSACSATIWIKSRILIVALHPPVRVDGSSRFRPVVGRGRGALSCRSRDWRDTSIVAAACVAPARDVGPGLAASCVVEMRTIMDSHGFLVA